VRQLIADLDACSGLPMEILLTGNAPDDAQLHSIKSAHPLRFVRNARPKGFAENHNANFRASQGQFFCVLNPDVRVTGDSFKSLLGELSDPTVGLVAPMTVDARARVQQSFRRVMTPLMLAQRALGLRKDLDYELAPRMHPDWVAGMFMLFRREVFDAIGGFDERYFLYCEDMDLCCRVWLAGLKVRVLGGVRVLHGGQYSSRRRLKFFLLHLQSLWRFWRSRCYEDFLAHRSRREA
jgi:N-acetylglucosaminyl-diphospho-decaprenol L-rhamnosyltransferase